MIEKEIIMNYNFDTRGSLDLTSVNTRSDLEGYSASNWRGGRSQRFALSGKRLLACGVCVAVFATLSVVAVTIVSRGRQGEIELSRAADPTVSYEATIPQGRSAEDDVPMKIIGDNTVKVRRGVKHRDETRAVILDDNPVGDSRTDAPAEAEEDESLFF